MQDSPTGSHWFPLTPFSSPCPCVLLSPSVPYSSTVSYGFFFLPLWKWSPTARSFKRGADVERCLRRGEVTKAGEEGGRREGWSERQRGSEKRDRWGGAGMKWKRDRAGNRGREGGVIIYQVFGCAWQRRKLISTLCVHQLHSQASRGIPLACLREAAGDTHTHTHSMIPRVHTVRLKSPREKHF